jgi:hypothetical protein
MDIKRHSQRTTGQSPSRVFVSEQRVSGKKLSGFDCPWTSTLSDITVHIKYKHVWDVSTVPCNLLMVLYKLARGMRYSSAVFILRELFYLICKFEGDAFSFGVFHIGTKEETEAFRFSIKMGSSKGNTLVTPEFHSYLEGDVKDLHPEKKCQDLLRYHTGFCWRKWTLVM